MFQVVAQLVDRHAAAALFGFARAGTQVRQGDHAGGAVYESKLDIVGREQFTPFMRMVMLQSIDSHWREHLAALDYLRQGIHLRGYAQKNPKQE